MSKYFRNSGGTVVHLSTCRYAVAGKPWEWADLVSDATAAYISTVNGYKSCAVCKPFAGAS